MKSDDVTSQDLAKNANACTRRKRAVFRLEVDKILQSGSPQNTFVVLSGMNAITFPLADVAMTGQKYGQALPPPCRLRAHNAGKLPLSEHQINKRGRTELPAVLKNTAARTNMAVS